MPSLGVSPVSPNTAPAGNPLPILGLPRSLCGSSVWLPAVKTMGSETRSTFHFWMGLIDKGFWVSLSTHWTFGSPSHTGWNRLSSTKFVWINVCLMDQKHNRIGRIELASDKTLCEEAPKRVRNLHLWRRWLREHTCNIKEIMKAVGGSHQGLLTKTENTEIKGACKKRKRQYLPLALTLICIVGKGNIWVSLSWDIV